MHTKEYDLEIEYTKIIKDELNVKIVMIKPDLQSGVELNTEIGEELKQEGNYRELVRAMQDMRKKIGLTPSDAVSVTFETDENGKKLIQKFETEIKKMLKLRNELRAKVTADKWHDAATLEVASKEAMLETM